MKEDALVSNTFRRRATRLMAPLAAVAALVAAAPSEVHAAGPVASLKPGEHAFWDGPYVERATVGAGDLCDVAGPCWTYDVVVERGEASRLRVAIDWPSSTNMYELDLFDPSGKQVGSMSGYGSWSDEMFAKNPAPGTCWPRPTRNG